MDNIDQLASAIEQINVARDVINDFLYTLPSSYTLQAMDEKEDCGCNSYDSWAPTPPAMFEHPDIYLELITLKADVVKKMLEKIGPSIDIFISALSDMSIEEAQEEDDEEMD